MSFYILLQYLFIEILCAKILSENKAFKGFLLAYFLWEKNWHESQTKAPI